MDTLIKNLLLLVFSFGFIFSTKLLLEKSGIIKKHDQVQPAPEIIKKNIYIIAFILGFLLIFAGIAFIFLLHKK